MPPGPRPDIRRRNHIVKMHDHLGLSWAEIGRRLTITESTVRTLYKRTKKARQLSTG